MKNTLSTIYLCVLVVTNSCATKNASEQKPSNNNIQVQHYKINADVAVCIAKTDALKVIGSIEEYIVVAHDDGKTWRVTFGLKNSQNGGPIYYNIDKMTGEIVHKTVYQ